MLGILHQGVVSKPRFGWFGFFIYPQVSVRDQPSFSSCERTAHCTSIFNTFLFSSSLQGGKGHSLAKLRNTFGLISLVSWSFTFASTAEEGNPSSQRDHSVTCGSFQQTVAGQVCLHLPLCSIYSPREYKPSLHPREMTSRHHSPLSNV